VFDENQTLPAFLFILFSPDTTKSKTHRIKVDNSSDEKREI